MRKTKNITVALTERNYLRARVYAANNQISVSGLVEFSSKTCRSCRKPFEISSQRTQISATHRFANPTKGGRVPPLPPRKPHNLQ
jgi:hypothetical protein